MYGDHRQTSRGKIALSSESLSILGGNVDIMRVLILAHEADWGLHR